MENKLMMLLHNDFTIDRYIRGGVLNGCHLIWAVMGTRDEFTINTWAVNICATGSLFLERNIFSYQDQD